MLFFCLIALNYATADDFKSKAGISLSFMATKAEIDHFSFTDKMIKDYNDDEVKSAVKFGLIYETMFPFLNSENFLLETKLSYCLIPYSFDHVFEAATIDERPGNINHKYTIYSIFENVEYDLSVISVEALLKYDIGNSGFQLVLGPSLGILLENTKLAETKLKSELYSYESQVYEQYIYFDSLYFKEGDYIEHESDDIDVLNSLYFSLVYGIQYELNISGFIISPYIYFTYSPMNIAKKNEWFFRTGLTGIELMMEL